MRVESLAVHVVHGRAKVYGDEDGVKQVKEESGDKVRVACSCGGSTKDLEDVVALGGRSNTCRHRTVANLPVWASLLQKSFLRRLKTIKLLTEAVSTNRPRLNVRENKALAEAILFPPQLIE